jgi:predicted RNA-binding protein with PIN domain
MNQNFLIDGYNLLHALGLVPKKIESGTLEKARERMLAFLADAHGDGASNVTVVFDAHKSRRKLDPVQMVRGLEVCFAVKHKLADDLIEEMVGQESVPRRLVVVSDDREVQKVAARRRCQVMGCEAYLDWLERQGQVKGKQSQPRPEKTEALTEDELRHWMAEFGDLDSDPGMKELFNPYDFDKDK